METGSGRSLTTLAEAPSQRYCVMICLSLDPRLRVAAYDILYSLLHHCAQQVFLATVTLAKNVPVVASVGTSAATLASVDGISKKGVSTSKVSKDERIKNNQDLRRSEVAPSAAADSTTASTDISTNPAVCASLAHSIIKALLETC